MHRRSKPCRKVPERTMTRSDIFKLVHGMRTRKHRETVPSDVSSDKSEESRSQDLSSEDLGGRETSSGVNVCIFPCNNPIEHVIAECYRHAKHGRGSATENSHSGGSEELSLSTCENLLSQISTKIEELQAEMKLYQTQNEHLKNMQQQYHQMLNKLQKDRDDFEAHKEKENNKLKSEIEEEKRKIRIEKRRQNLTKASKVEMKLPTATAKDKNSNKEAQGQLQRKVNLLTSENGRLRDKLQLAEQEKDSLKAMVKELEGQRISLLEKLEKMSELKRSASLNELALSPVSRLIMPMLVPPPSSPFQTDGLQLPLESAHGDSFCLEARNCREPSFDLASRLHPRDILAKTREQTSEPSVVVSATVVARLSLDSCLGSRSPMAASPAGACNKDDYSPALWSSDGPQKFEQKTTCTEEYPVSRPVLRQAAGQISKAVRFATHVQTSQSDSTVLSSLGKAPAVKNLLGDLQSETVRSVLHASNDTSGQAVSRTDLYTSYKGSSSTRKFFEVPLREMLMENDEPSECTSKVEKVGLITKEILTNTSFKRPSTEIQHFRVAVPNLAPPRCIYAGGVNAQTPILSTAYIPTEVPEEMLPSIAPTAPKVSNMNLCLKESSSLNVASKVVSENSKKGSNEGEPSHPSLSREFAKITESSEGFEQDQCTNVDIQIARNGQADRACHQPEQGQCASSEQAAKEAKQPCWEQNEDLHNDKRTGSDTNVSKGGDHSEWESYEEPEQSPLVCGSEYAKDAMSSRLKFAEEQLCNKCGSEQELTESSVAPDDQSQNEESQETRSSLREILQNLGSQFPMQAPQAMLRGLLQDRLTPVGTSRWKKPADLPSVPSLSADNKVSSLIKKYSQVNTSNESRGTHETMKARKSQSAQIQSSSHLLERSPEKNDSRTWALDSKGQKMLLTVVSKEIDPFTQVIIYKFQNGDRKDMHPDGKVVYHYGKSQTVHTVYPCGKKEIKFSNGQVETHSKGGDIEVKYPDGTTRRIFCTGEEEQQTPDGTVARRLRDGTETIDYPNGQKEVRSELYRSRYYPNGTVKTVYMDGKQVTRYPNGRVRVKEADGTVSTS